MVLVLVAESIDMVSEESEIESFLEVFATFALKIALVRADAFRGKILVSFPGVAMFNVGMVGMVIEVIWSWSVVFWMNDDEWGVGVLSSSACGFVVVVVTLTSSYDKSGRESVIFVIAA